MEFQKTETKLQTRSLVKRGCKRCYKEAFKEVEPKKCNEIKSGIEGSKNFFLNSQKNVIPMLILYEYFFDLKLHFAIN